MTAEPPSTTPSTTPRLPFPLQANESVVAIIRRHWIFFWPTIASQFIAGLAPVILVGVLLELMDWLDGRVVQIYALLAAVYIAYWAVRLGLTWYRYRNDFWVVTSQRLIDCHRKHPFDLVVSTADLVNVQDMTVERTGILSTFLDYGSVICDTASAEQDFVIGGVPHPRDVQALVDRERDRERAALRHTSL